MLGMCVFPFCSLVSYFNTLVHFFRIHTDAKKFYVTEEREKMQIKKRIKEPGNIIRCSYEDRMTGRITPKRYDMMSGGYEQEQAELRQN